MSSSVNLLSALLLYSDVDFLSRVDLTCHCRQQLPQLLRLQLRAGRSDKRQRRRRQQRGSLPRDAHTYAHQLSHMLLGREKPTPRCRQRLNILTRCVLLWKYMCVCVCVFCGRIKYFPWFFCMCTDANLVTSQTVDVSILHFCVGGGGGGVVLDEG